MDLSKVNEALKPLGVTFEELFRERYSEIQELGFEIERKQITARHEATYEEAKELYAEIKELENKKESLIYGRLVKEV